MLVCVPLTAPIGLSPWHILICGAERVLVVSTEPLVVGGGCSGVCPTPGGHKTMEVLTQARGQAQVPGSAAAMSPAGAPVRPTCPLLLSLRPMLLSLDMVYPPPPHSSLFHSLQLSQCMCNSMHQMYECQSFVPVVLVCM